MQGGQLLDACGVDGMGLMSMPSGLLGQAISMDPSTFFVGDIDATEAQRPNLRACRSSNDLLIADMDSTDLLLNQSELLLGSSAPAGLAGHWDAFPSIPENSELQMQVPNFPGGGMTGQPAFIPMDPSASAGSLSAGASPSSSTSSGADAQPRGFPRIASMPNLPLSAAGGYTDLRRRAAANRSGMPRSRSASDVTDLAKYIVPHSEFLTPPHLRKGKGGRQPALDPRLDPKIDPKKAKRILANRLSAARSKMKQKSVTDAMRQRMEMLHLQRETLSSEVTALSDACAVQEAEREVLRRQLQATEDRLRGLNGFPAGKGTFMEPFSPSRLGVVG